MDPENEGGTETAESIDDFIGEAFETEELEAPAEVEPTEEEPEEGAAEAALEEGSEENSEPEADTSEEEEKKEDPAEEREPDAAITAPQSMSAKDRETFYALPPEQQKWLSDRAHEQQTDYTKKTMELAEQRKTFDKLEQVIAPRRQALLMEGMDESTAIGQLFALSDFANNDPVGFTKYLFQQRGIPLSSITETGGANPVDPQVMAMQQKLHGLENHLNQQTQAQAAQQEQAVQGAISSFAAKHQFYSELEADMIPLVTAFKQADPGLSNEDALTKAYNAAISANPEISARVAADADAKRIAEAKKTAGKAKKAAGTNLKSKGSLPAKAIKAETEDDFIGALVEERMAG